MNSLKLGCVKPQGWILDQMNRDLVDGFVGRLDEIVPELIVEDDIYGKDRLTKNYKVKNLGVAEEEVEGSLQLQWWNSETQSNWYDGLVRNTVLVENKEYSRKINNYINRILGTQDEDGYIGIYDKELRYNFNFESGELWAQSTVFRSLLSYYEATNEEEVLNAVKKAIDVTMNSYKINESKPFKFEQTHGLTLVDVLEKLYRYTQERKYIDYAIWLYKDFCESEVEEEDVQVKNLLNNKYNFKEHGVHTYEHLRALVIAAYEDNNTYEIILEKYLEKLERCICPSGAPIGDEWIDENIADPSMRGYEYCSIHELLHSYMLLLEKSNDFKWADKIEWILFNAAQGARHNNESSIAYLKSDNSYKMNGEFQFEQKCRHKTQTRYKYSPSHQDAAVCCVPNAGRIYTYYVQGMWQQSEDELVKCIYGPSTMKTQINGTNIEIEEKSNYPFNNELEFKVRVDNKSKFKIVFRKPKWCKSVEVTGVTNTVEFSGNRIIIDKEWEKESIIKLKFDYDIKTDIDLVGDLYVTYGPLVYALELQGVEKVGKKYSLNEFRDTYYEVDKEIPDYLLLNEELVNKFTIEINNADIVWKNISLRGEAFNNKTNLFETINIVPMGGTILRKVTFKKVKGRK